MEECLRIEVLLKVSDALCMIVYNSTLSHGDLSSVDAYFDALLGGTTGATVLVIVSTCLRLVAFPNGLLLLLGLFLEAH